ncbi:acyl-CoA reductase [Tuberibacillus sp. Marseille-P3662]|uniref:acyl-CoA reductase n=1 Tax=Tuberibacillus sp. Marseille-P3662 TaxID=1965358 RepID=UPI000A1CA3DB|nr:acyl-CoA reductase [Tuberibacillus sp. Marseille-P3662]
MSGRHDHLDAFYIPENIDLDSFTERVFSSEDRTLTLRLPKLSAGDITDIARIVKHHREWLLTNVDVMEIVDVVDQAVQKWLDPEYHWRRLAERWLPEITGYDKEIIRLELKRFMRTFRKKALARFLHNEFDNPSVLDGFRPSKSGGFTKAYGPDVVFNVFSGNIPGLPIWSLVMGLLLKSGIIGKTSSAEPLMPVLFARSIEEVSPELGSCLAILPWKGGTAELEDAAIAEAEAIVAYGSNESLEAIKKRVPATQRFIGYGHKISFAMIGQEALTPDRFDDTVQRLAEDVSIYDQQGCLSPHAVFVEAGGSVAPQAFAQMLATALQRYDDKRPRGTISHAEAIAIRSERSRFEFTESDVYTSSDNTHWTVIVHHEPGFAASPLNRTIHVFGCQHLSEAMSYIQPFKSYLQSVGVAVAPQRLFPLAEQLGQVGVTRVTAVGNMSRTTPGWHHDGGMNLLDLVRWVDIEYSAEHQAEDYDLDAE